MASLDERLNQLEEWLTPARFQRLAEGQAELLVAADLYSKEKARDFFSVLQHDPTLRLNFREGGINHFTHSQLSAALQGSALLLLSQVERSQLLSSVALCHRRSVQVTLRMEFLCRWQWTRPWFRLATFWLHSQAYQQRALF